MGSPPPSDICVIGLGSRGLGVLERIVTLTRTPDWEGLPLVVDVIDPTCDGTGIHTQDQPDYLLLNTVCSQLSIFPERSSVGEHTGKGGPDLHTWVTERGLRLSEDGYTLGARGRPIRPDDFLPRHVLGSYLHWCLGRLLGRAPEHLRIRMCQRTAVSLTSDENGSYVVGLDDGDSLRTGHVFLTLGHTRSARTARSVPSGGEHRFISDIYPTGRAFARVEAGQTIALAGTGLSGMDALAELTLGRGGRYVLESGTRRYVPSGEEPRVLLYTRSGLPFRARPVVNRAGGAPEALVFTPDALERARRFRTAGRLSLVEDILPLLRDEMRLAFHRRCAALLGSGDQVEQRLRASCDSGSLGAELTALDGEHAPSFGAFDPLRLLFPESDGLANSASYQEWYLGQVKDDLGEASLGLAGSPLKAGLEILRDHRDTMRYAVDFEGLDDASHQDFYGRVTSSFNRAVTGPQLERHEELIALVRSGVVAIPFGPSPRVDWETEGSVWRLTSTRLGNGHAESADWLCLATSDQPEMEHTANPLVAFLRDRSVLRRHRPSSRSSRGVDVTPEFHPVGADGRVHTRMWVLGPLCEGTTFYNHYVPSPGGASRALQDAQGCVTAALRGVRASRLSSPEHHRRLVPGPTGPGTDHGIFS